jgi:hypothetical protein
MKNLSQDKHYIHEYNGHLINVEPFLKLLDLQRGHKWVENMDEAMLCLVELNSAADGTLSGELLYELFYDLRLVRDAFKEVASSSNQLSDAAR